MAKFILLLGLLIATTASCGPANPGLQAPEPTEPPIDVAATVAAAVASRQSEPTKANEPSDADADAGSSTPVTPTVTATVEAPSTETANSDVVSATAVPLGAETAVPSAKANAAADNWLLSFTHTNPDYIRVARSALAFAEDGEFCEAASRFGAIALDARDYAGERLPIAAYNAGVLYLVLSWDDRQSGRHAMCFQSSPARPAINSAVAALEYALPYLADDQHKAAAHVLLGRAYANKAHMERTRLVIGEARAKEQAEIVDENAAVAIEHLCQSITLDEAHNDLAHTILAEVDGACGQ